MATILVGTGASRLNAQTFNVLDYGATGSGFTDDTLAIQAAVNAAGMAGGGTVHFPCGQYRVGATGANRFYSGIQVTFSNIVMSGPSPVCAEILPGFTWGGVLVAACPAFLNTPLRGANQNCAVGPELHNFTIRDLSFRDDAPDEHCYHYGYVAPGDCVSEETHGITVSHASAVTIENNVFEALGDESITISAPGIVRGNEFVNTPGIPRSGGAAIVVDGHDIEVRDNVIHGTVSDPVGEGCDGFPCVNTGRAISIETNSGGESSNIAIRNNLVFDFEGYYGILVSSSQARVHDVTIEGNSIAVGSDPSASCVSPSTTCVDIGDTGCVSKQRCSILLEGSTGTPVAREDILIARNQLIGGVRGVEAGGEGLITVSENVIYGAAGKGLTIAGSPLQIERNAIQGFREEAIYVLGLNMDDNGTGSVTIRDNWLLANNSDGIAESTIGMFKPTFFPCGDDGVVPGGVTVDRNEIVGASSGGAMSRGVDFSACARYIATGNTIDFNGSAASGSLGLSQPWVAYRNKIIGATGYGILTGQAEASAVENVIDLAGEGSRGVYGNLANDMIVQGNFVVNATLFGADVSGLRPLCTGNLSLNTLNAFDRRFACGTDGSGLGCAPDAAAEGICNDNFVCRSNQAGCSTLVRDTDGDTLSDDDELYGASSPILADTDDDGRLDPSDNCPSKPNPGQEDDDSNGIGNVCDPQTVPESESLPLLLITLAVVERKWRSRSSRLP